MHWTEPYIGRPYVTGEYDCASLVLEIQRDVFGREVADYGERPALRSDQHQALVDEAKKRVERVETPQEGDAVQMLVRGTMSHVGVYTNINGEGHVLHNVRRVGVILTKIRDLPMKPWKLEGFYQWK